MHKTPLSRPHQAARPHGGAPVWQGFIAFQVAWFAVVWGAAHGLALPGCGVLLAVLIWHVHGSQRRLQTVQIGILFCLIGMPLEWLNQWFSGFRYTADGTLPTLGYGVPCWVIGLWALLSMGLRYTLVWLRKRYVLAAAIGGVAGPVSIDAGIRLGAGHYIDRPVAWATLSIMWCVATPLLLWLSEAHDA